MGMSEVETVQVVRAHRLCLDPRPDQRQLLARHAGFARRGFNWAIAEKRAAWERQQQERAWLTYTEYAGLSPEKALAKAKPQAAKAHPVPSAFGLSKRYTIERGSVDEVTGEIVEDGVFPWWRGLNRYAFVSGLRHADDAFSNFFDSLAGRRAGRRVGYPRFKKKGRSRDSFTIYHDVKRPGIRLVDSRHLLVPTLGQFRLHSNVRRLVRKIDRGTVTVNSVTIAREGHRWFASVLVTEQMPAPRTTRRQQRAGTVGVDVGVNRLVSCSDGSGVENPRHLRASSARLVKAQRALSRTQRGSSNRRKAAARVGRLQAQLAERRAQYLHQVTKRLATGYAVIGVEDLDVLAMTASARGTVEAPGRQVRQKSGLNRAILDASFGEFVRQLEYKAAWYGSKLQKVDRWFPSSKTCSACGQLHKDLGRGDRLFCCPACGHRQDRDHNAAVNLAVEATRLIGEAKSKPAAAGVCTTPDNSCDARDPEASIGVPEKLARHRGGGAAMIQADPRGHPDPATGRRSKPTLKRAPAARFP